MRLATSAARILRNVAKGLRYSAPLRTATLGLAGAPSRSERPSNLQPGCSPSRSTPVGRTSTVWAAPSSVRPPRWPGAFTKSGTEATSGKLAFVT
jgi:hypothetical protein